MIDATRISVSTAVSESMLRVPLIPVGLKTAFTVAEVAAVLVISEGGTTGEFYEKIQVACRCEIVAGGGSEDSFAYYVNVGPGAFPYSKASTFARSRAGPWLAS
jgi:hypothetical protein